jgi:hypothetical protein
VAAARWLVDARRELERRGARIERATALGAILEEIIIVCIYWRSTEFWKRITIKQEYITSGVMTALKKSHFLGLVGSRTKAACYSHVVIASIIIHYSRRPVEGLLPHQSTLNTKCQHPLHEPRSIRGILKRSSIRHLISYRLFVIHSFVVC